MRVCTICNIEKPLSEFYKYKTRSGYRPDCRDCRNSWTREYNKRPDSKIRRNKKGNKWAQKNVSSWVGFIPKETNCQVCGEKIYFSNKNIKTAIHFDHKSEECSIKGSPTQWLLKHHLNEKNKEIWIECNFGMLCGRCNRGLPTKNRLNWLEKINIYVKGKNENPISIK